jgi:hypothetical protein
MKETLGEVLPKQQARVRDLIIQYRDPLLGGSGIFAAAMMEQSLKNADNAVMSGDVVKMIEAFNDLKGYE